jgi:hypothetical protein
MLKLLRFRENPAFCLARTICLIAVAIAIGCDSSPGSSARVAAETGGPAEPACASAAENDPSVLRGRVLAPFGKLARLRPTPLPAPTLRTPATDSPFPDWLVARASAAPLEKERTVPNATVRLYRVDATGEQIGEALGTATSDFSGNWCIELPAGIDFGADLMIEASMEAMNTEDATAARLRRSVVADFATDIYASSEALTRLLQAHDVDFTRIPAATYLNMESIADTRIDLLSPVELEPGANLESAVDEIKQVLAADPRLMEKIDSLIKIK